MRPRWHSLILAAGLALAPASVLAQPRPVSIAGAWRLETAPHHETGCVIVGDARITAGGAGRYSVLVDMVETCPGDIKFTATERCPATVTGQRVAMACTVLRMGELGYLADTFSLELRGYDVMVGRLVDTGHWNEPVTWRRAAPALTS